MRNGWPASVLLPRRKTSRDAAAAELRTAAVAAWRAVALRPRSPVPPRRGWTCAPGGSGGARRGPTDSEPGRARSLPGIGKRPTATRPLLRTRSSEWECGSTSNRGWGAEDARRGQPSGLRSGFCHCCGAARKASVRAVRPAPSVRSDGDVIRAKGVRAAQTSGVEPCSVLCCSRQRCSPGACWLPVLLKLGAVAAEGRRRDRRPLLPVDTPTGRIPCSRRSSLPPAGCTGRPARGCRLRTRSSTAGCVLAPIRSTDLN